MNYFPDADVTASHSFVPGWGLKTLTSLSVTLSVRNPHKHQRFQIWVKQMKPQIVASFSPAGAGWVGSAATI